MRLATLYPILVASLAISGGCAIRPSGEDEERERALALEARYSEEREIPQLPPDPRLSDYLRFAYLSSPELERRYWEWRVALEQIPQDSSFPNVAIPASYTFRGGGDSAWDRTTLGITNDAMVNIPFPTKLAAAGRRALEEARAAGLRFEAARFALRERVIGAYADLALLAESIRIEEETVALLGLLAAQAETGLRAGRGAQQDLLGAQTELALSRNRLESLRSQVAPWKSRLNSVIGRDAELPLPDSRLPASALPPRPLPARDDELIRLGSERNPELAALAREVRGREEALSLARQAWIPDFSLSFSFMGSVSQTIGGAIVLPTRLEAIRAGIAQARASLAAAEAARSQYSRDLASSLIGNLSVVRNAERQMSFFEAAILPLARQTVEAANSSHATGKAGFREVLEAHRTLLEVRLTLAQIRAEREKALAAVESLIAIDAEALAGQPVEPAAQTGNGDKTADRKTGHSEFPPRKL